MSIDLTLVMIVRDEASRIEKTISNAREFADQIVVNDTGSIDATVEILKQMGVEYFESKWQNSFAVARNQTLPYAKGRWVFWMDADDFVPPETVKLICELKQLPADRIIGFEIINRLNTDNGGARFLQVRMFPKLSELYWEGVVHEQIEYSAQRLGLPMVHYTSPIEHHGYIDQKTNQKKALRNLQLILSDQERLKTDPAFAASLGDAYYILEEWDKGMDAYKKIKHIQSALQKNADVVNEVPFWVALGCYSKKDYSLAYTYFQEAMHAKPNKIEAPYYAALCMQQLGNDELALTYWRKAISLLRPVTGTVNRYDILRPQALRQGVLLAIKLGGTALQEAQKWSSDLLAEHPNAVEAYHVQGLVEIALGNHARVLPIWIKGLGLNPGASLELVTDLVSYLKQQPQMAPMLVSVLDIARKHFPSHF